MTEEVDKAKSWTVLSNKTGVRLIPTHWAPGYTEGHKATEEQAIASAILLREEEIQSLSDEIKALYELEKNL